MPKYIIHIGPPKTGSKYIQSQLFHSRKFLETNGVLYPDNWWTRPDNMYHDSLFDIIRERRLGMESEFEKLNRTKCETIVLSSEALDGLQHTELQRLRDAVGDNPVEIVYYARRWSDRITSDWRERVRMGYSTTFPEFYIRLLTDPGQTGEINYSRVWERFAKVFGRQSLKIVPFSNLVDGGVDPFDHFCRVILGLPETPRTAPEFIQRNESASMIDTEILRTLNYFNYIDTSTISINMRVKFDILKDGNDGQVQEKYKALEKPLRSDMRELSIDDSATPFEPIWQLISTYTDRLVDSKPGVDIFERRNLKLKLVGQDYLLQSEVVYTLKALFEYLRSTPVIHPIFEITR